METIRLFIIEDKPTPLKSQIKVLGNFEDIEIVGSAMSGEEAIAALERLAQGAHVVLCDLILPKMNGIETMKRIRTMSPKTEIVLFTINEDENLLLQALHAGASGYLLKGVDGDKIHQAIVDVFHGGTIIQPRLARKLIKHFAKPLDYSSTVLFIDEMKKTTALNALLTIRELECLQIIAKGLSNHEAAAVLNLSKATVRTHLEHIYQKLDVSNRVEAVTEGIRQGIINL